MDDHLCLLTNGYKNCVLVDPGPQPTLAPRNYGRLASWPCTSRHNALAPYYEVRSWCRKKFCQSMVFVPTHELWGIWVTIHFYRQFRFFQMPTTAGRLSCRSRCHLLVGLSFAYAFRQVDLKPSVVWQVIAFNELLRHGITEQQTVLAYSLSLRRDVWTRTTGSLVRA